MNKQLPWVYIASPLSKGNYAWNVNYSVKVFTKLLDEKKCIPYTPLSSVLSDMICPIDYNGWLYYDLALLERFDILLRLNTKINKSKIGCNSKNTSYNMKKSLGADREEKRFKDLDKPIVYSIKELYALIDRTKILNPRF